MSTPQYLQKENVTAAGGFVGGALWQDFKRVLSERRPEPPITSDNAETAAAKAHQRRGFELCLELIEALPFETPAEASNPFERPAVQETAD